MMRSAVFAIPLLAMVALSNGSASAQDPVLNALEGCQNELRTFCSEVTPGDGRLLSCARAYEDKLSAQCGYAINRATYWLEFLGNTLRYVTAQCAADALKYCPDVELGEQRVINCLVENRENLNNYCSIALADIGK